MKTFEQWADRTFGSDFKSEDSLTYFRMSAAWDAATNNALERAAVVCESSPSYDWHKFACEAAAAIRALKENT